MKILHLTLKKKWFDMIASGEKKEEYREIKPYWERRFCPTYMQNFPNRPKSSLYPETMNIYSIGAIYDFILFRNGYATNAPEILVECKGIEIGTAKPEWSDNWQGEVFVIKLGEIITANPPKH